MALILNRRIWVLAERLYITAHGHKDFLNFLRTFDIDYPGEPYKKFKTTTKGIYLFMSHENYEIAKFMQLVPSYKYLEILSPIVFDRKIAETKNDNWNYYGEFIKHWYPELIDLLKLAGVRLNKKAKILEFEENENVPSAVDFLANSFGDPFLDYMRKEINDAYANRLFLSVMFLSG